MKKKTGEAKLVEDTGRVLGQTLKNAKESFDVDFKLHLQELDDLKSKYKGIAKQDTFGVPSLQQVFQPTPFKRAGYASPIVKSEPRTRRVRRNLNSPVSPYRPKTPQRAPRIVDSNYVLPPGRLAVGPRGPSAQPKT